MKGDRGSMGTTKHGQKGHAGKSPRFRHNQKIDLQKQEASTRKRKTKWYQTVREIKP